MGCQKNKKKGERDMENGHELDVASPLESDKE